MEIEDQIIDRMPCYLDYRMLIITLISLFMYYPLGILKLEKNIALFVINLIIIVIIFTASLITIAI